MRPIFAAFIALSVSGCNQSPPELDIETARLALADRIASDPKVFGSYGAPTRLQLLRKVPPVQRDDWFDFNVGDIDGPLRLSAVRIDPKSRTYSAERLHPVLGLRGHIRYYSGDSWSGAFEFDESTRSWKAGAPRFTQNDPPPLVD